MAHVVVGTAGHIDHGKSSLVRALTGTDPDRLPEEKRRQITIDLGYAFLDDVAAIIDVPGHEKFIHNMVAGASTVDFALLVVAADDGVMPQTTEHLHILNLLGIRQGAVVLTKISLTENNWRDMVIEQIREAVSSTFLRGAPIFQVDSLSQQGIPELRRYLLDTLADMPRREDRGSFRLAIDRVFAMHGHGAVVTGTILSGKVSPSAKLSVYPEAHAARVKQLQTHGRTAAELQPGMRAALNLHYDGELRRGQTIADPDSLLATTRLLLSYHAVPSAPALKDRQRVRFLITTQEVMGRIRIAGTVAEKTFLTIDLDEPVVASWGDHFILRRYSPLDTLGGGRVLDPIPPRIAAKDRQLLSKNATLLEVDTMRTAVEKWIVTHAENGVELSTVARTFGLPLSALEAILKNSEEHFMQRDEWITTSQQFEAWKSNVKSHIEQLHKKHLESEGFSLGQVQNALPNLSPALLDLALSALVNAGEIQRKGALFLRASIGPTVPEAVRKLSEEIAGRLKTSGFAPPSAGALAEELKRSRSDVERALVHLDKQGLTFRLGNDLFFDKAAFAAGLDKTKHLLNRGPVQVAELSKALESSRKYVVPFLEYLDTLGITERRDNLRVPGRNFSL